MSALAKRYGVIVAVAIVACVIPLLLADQTFYVQMILSAIVVTGLSLFMGYAGQASLGQGAFVAVGAFTVATMTVQFQLPPLLALLCAPVISAAFAYLVGFPLLRLRGPYLAFGTIAMLLILQAVFSALPLFGGGIGISGIPPLGIGPFVVQDQIVYVYLALIVLALLLVASRNLVTSRFGRGIRALSVSETAAASSGVAVLRSKLAVFAMSAAAAGLAGGLAAFVTPYVSGASYTPLASFTYLIMAVVGGLGTLWGGVVGAVLISLLVQLLTTASNLPGVPETAATIIQYAVYAVVLILFLLFLPRGLIPEVRRLVGRSLERRRGDDAGGGSGAGDAAGGAAAGAAASAAAGRDLT